MVFGTNVTLGPLLREYHHVSTASFAPTCKSCVAFSELLPFAGEKIVIIGGVVSGPRIVIGTAGEMEVMAWVPGRRGFIVIKAAYTVRPTMDGKLGIDNVTVAWPFELRIP